MQCQFNFGRKIIVIELEELQTLIPHQGKMLLLSRVIEYNIEHGIRAEYDITRNCLFYDPVTDGVPVWTAFEFMAQAISVLSGIRSREKGERPKLGFILSIPSMRMEVPLFKNGSSVEVCVQETDCTEMIYTFDGTALVEGKKVMEGKMMVMEVSDERFNELTGGVYIR
jgi:predicted hotdog family 3-hydroxylacyl-ACP dehydratase